MGGNPHRDELAAAHAKISRLEADLAEARGARRVAAAPGPRRIALMAALAGVLVATVSVLTVGLRRHDRAPLSASASAAPALSAPTRASAPASASASAPASADRTTVHVGVHATPPEAHVQLDNHELTNPASFDLPESTYEHVLVVYAPGYRARSVRFRGDRDTSLEIVLERDGS